MRHQCFPGILPPTIHLSGGDANTAFQQPAEVRTLVTGSWKKALIEASLLNAGPLAEAAVRRFFFFRKTPQSCNHPTLPPTGRVLTARRWSAGLSRRPRGDRAGSNHHLWPRSAASWRSVCSFAVMLFHFFAKRNTSNSICPSKLFPQIRKISATGFSIFFAGMAIGILTVLVQPAVFGIPGSRRLIGVQHHLQHQHLCAAPARRLSPLFPSILVQRSACASVKY